MVKVRYHYGEIDFCCVPSIPLGYWMTGELSHYFGVINEIAAGVWSGDLRSPTAYR